MNYRLQIRQFEELRQWRGPRNIPMSRTHFSPWKTVAMGVNIEALKQQGILQTRTGLKQWRILYGTKVVADQEGDS